MKIINLNIWLLLNLLFIMYFEDYLSLLTCLTVIGYPDTIFSYAHAFHYRGKLPLTFTAIKIHAHLSAPFIPNYFSEFFFVSASETSFDIESIIFF